MGLPPMTLVRGPVIALLVLSATPVSAAPVSAELWTSGPADLKGVANVTMELKGIDMALDEGHLEAVGRGTIVVAEAIRTTWHATLPGVNHRQEAHDTFREDSWPVEGRWRIFPIASDAFVRILPIDSALEVSPAGMQSWRTSAPFDHIGRDYVGGPPVDVAGYANVPQGPMSMSDTNGSLHVTGNFLMFVHNATVRVGNASWQAGPQEINVSGQTEVATASAGTYQHILIITHSAQLHLQGPLRLYVSGLKAAVDQIALHQVDGALVAKGVEWDEEAGLLKAEGTLHASYQAVTNGRGQWKFSGDATKIAVNGEPRLWETPAVAVATFLIAAMLIKLLPALWAGAHRAEPFASRTRRRVFAFIKENPGCSRGDLVEAIGTTRHNIAYHTRVLMHHHLIDVQKFGRIEHYMLNSGTFRRMLPGDVRLRESVAATNHPIRGRVVAMLEQGTMNYNDMLHAWQGTPPSKSLLSYHMQRLQKIGLVRMNRRRQWELTVEGGLSRWMPDEVTA